MIPFGDKVANLRKKRNLTQESLGKLCEVSKKTVISWESGVKPRWKKIRLLSSALNCSTLYLYDDEEDNRLADIEKDYIMEEIESEYGFDITEKIYKIACSAGTEFFGTSQGKAGSDDVFRSIASSLVRCSIRAEERLNEKRERLGKK